jgi:hypothetical protein
MITNNFKRILGAILLSNSTDQTGKIAVKKQDGNTVYISAFINAQQFPASVSSNVVNSNSSSGIRIGSGNTPATENDYALESPITSGYTASTPSIDKTVDNNGNVSLDYTFTVTNTGSADLTIREIGYFQNKSSGNTLNGSATNFTYLLLDRTVLDAPVVIPAGEYAAIKYSLKLILSE